MRRARKRRLSRSAQRSARNGLVVRDGRGRLRDRRGAAVNGEQLCPDGKTRHVVTTVSAFDRIPKRRHRVVGDVRWQGDLVLAPPARPRALRRRSHRKARSEALADHRNGHACDAPRGRLAEALIATEGQATLSCPV